MPNTCLRPRSRLIAAAAAVVSGTMLRTVNLPNGTTLTVTYGGTEGHPENATTLGTFTLNDGAGHFAGSKDGPAGPNDNLYILSDGTIILTATDLWWADQFTC